MPEQLQNIFWMAEELDFDIESKNRDQANSDIVKFLELTTNPMFSHWLYQA
ncbi:hypothetical protein KJZ63_00025 [Patescibacteria group bacterium]|nr:hypothetical protein [Patescibacteria group bacterium]